MVGMTALTIAIIRLLPRLTRAIPSPLAAIASVTALSQVAALPLRRVGDIASVAGALPSFHLPQVPLSLETLAVVLPFSAGVAAVGLIETLLTQQIVDDLTDTTTMSHVECIGQGAGEHLGLGVGGTQGTRPGAGASPAPRGRRRRRRRPPGLPGGRLTAPARRSRSQRRDRADVRDDGVRDDRAVPGQRAGGRAHAALRALPRSRHGALRDDVLGSHRRHPPRRPRRHHVQPRL